MTLLSRLTRLTGIARLAGGAPRPGRVRFGDLRRLRPVSDHWGYDRGGPVDRYYIEAFLGAHAGDVRGRVLEIGDDAYTRQFGGARVAHSDVLHVEAGNPRATIVGDLADAPQVPSGAFDAVVLTQTLHLIYDMPAAVRTLHRVLRPGGVALVTVPGISRVDRGEWGRTWYWSLTPASLERLFADAFGAPQLQMAAYGNVLSACAFLQGLGAGELERAELDDYDPCFPVVVAVRAVKADVPASGAPASGAPASGASV